MNRRSEVPVRATITSLRGDTKDNLVKISGFNEWLAVRSRLALQPYRMQRVVTRVRAIVQFKSTALSYMELLKPESLVYLTADSPNTITSLDKNKVRYRVRDTPGSYEWIPMGCFCRCISSAGSLTATV